jgi:hemolysin activation/secretion protein
MPSFWQRSPRLFGAVAAICLATVSAPASAAPAPPLPGAVQPGHDRPIPQAPLPPDFDFSIEAPHRSPIPRAVDEIHFKLAGVRIEGAVTLSADSFRPLYQDLIGKEITLADILNVADAIEQEYRAAGYLLVRAYVPPQKVNDGIFRIVVVEGFVSSTVVDGGDPAARDIIKSYLAPVVDEKPLRLPTIERALLLSNDIPGVTATGVLRPSPDVPGASDLAVTVTQPDISGGIETDNRGSHYSGLWTVTANAQYNSIFGADQLSANITASPHSLEQVGGQVRYRKAIGDDGLVGSLVVGISHGQPGAALGALDVRTDSWAIGPRLSYPLIRTRAQTLTIDGGITVQDARVKILDAPISHDQWRVADIALSYLSNDFLYGSMSSTLDISQGLPIFGATPNDSPNISQGGKTDFTKLSGLFRYTVPLFPQFSAQIAAQGQYSFQPLITGEQILFGGTQIGRGYDPGAITGDRGIGGSFELRYDTALPEWHINQMQPYTFFDAAQTWFIPRSAVLGPSLGDYSLASVGAGIRFWFPYNVYGDVEVARMLDSVPGSNNGKRETKILLDLAVNY